MKKQEKNDLLKFLSKAKKGEYAEVEKSSIDYVRMEIETDMSSAYTEYFCGLR